MTRYPVTSVLWRRASWMVAFCALLLVGCASAPPIPKEPISFALPRWVHVTQGAPGEAKLDFLLVAQREGQTTRWSLFDPLGVPQARQILDQGKWSNDGFLPPNRRARALFSALIFAWTPPESLARAYAPGEWQASMSADGNDTRRLLKNGTPVFAVQWQSPSTPDTFSITQPDGMHWSVAPLKDRP